MDALAVVGEEEALALLSEDPGLQTEKTLGSWALDVDCSPALRLGLVRDESVLGLVRVYWDGIQAEKTVLG